MTHISARESAFLALDSYFRSGVFIDEAIDQFKKELSTRDFALAYEIATGVVRRKNALDALARKYAATPKKRPEKVLLRMCLYQLLFLDRIPSFAIGDEMVDLAKKHTSGSFAKFLNAFLRNQASKCSLNDLTRQELLSYPDFFVDRLQTAYGMEKAFEILELGNKKMPLFARDRQETKMVAFDGAKLDDYLKNPRYYIQNPAQFQVYSHLKNSLKNAPKTILDLTASPGGKTILLHDFFANARLAANDISEKKVVLLKENLRQYGVEAAVSTGCGLEYPSNQLFDLVVVDAPCSNSGCLYKCPEARWRLTESDLAAHVELQKMFLWKAVSLLAPGGAIWYSTCSILPEENQQIVASMPQLDVITQHQVLPSQDGSEGGYGASLKLKTVKPT